jgi:hypothetical protein
MPNEDLMPNEIPNLWPTDLLDLQISTPLAILKKQANDLATATSAILHGEVVTESRSGRFEHNFFIVAPALDYRYKLFEVDHGVELYPCEGYFRDFRTGTTLQSENQLISWLSDVFRDPNTHKTLASLISQSRA